MQNNKKQTIGLFVDTQNLYYSARNSNTKQVDYQKLLELVIEDRVLQQASAYVVEREGAATAFGFITKLSSLGYRVKRKASGDGDFVPILELAQSKGCRVEIIAFKDTAHQDLLDMADRFINLASEKQVFVMRDA